MEMPHSHHPLQMPMQLPTPYDLPLDSSCSNQQFDWDKLSPLPLPDDIHLLLENGPVTGAGSTISHTHSHAPSSIDTGLSLDSCIDPWLQPGMDQWAGFEWAGDGPMEQVEQDGEADYDDIDEDEDASDSASRGNGSRTTHGHGMSTRNRPATSPLPPSSNQTTKHLTGKRKAHYRIEKRYRTNINDKIRALEEMLPKQPTAHNGSSAVPGLGSAPGTGIPSSPRKSKGEVLSRVIDYIIALRGKEAWQEKKIEELNRRIRASRQALDL
ncbi:uncharacterized protein BDV14DRAFT_202219 [Aspergillus stella-maris]|uniref:uncharacterized protein n=1 Tax=Aspergillus stella-maris TaxID=1810926 RepID=UPI003CCDA058